MCGITGSLNLSNSGYSVDVGAIQYSLLIASTLRGIDGTGIAVGEILRDGKRHKDDLFFIKKAVPATGFASKGELQQHLNWARWCITHTRSATIGKIDDESCHPFSEGPVVGVHNGTVPAASFELGTAVGLSDSHVIYKAISEVEPDGAVNILKKLEHGAYAMVWYDTRTETLRFARNADRPLWFYKHQSTWFWASEPSMIAFAIARNSTAKPLQYTDIVPWLLKKHTLVDIPVNGDPASFISYTPPPPPVYQQRTYPQYRQYPGVGNAYPNYGYPHRTWDEWFDDDDYGGSYFRSNPVTGEVSPKTDDGNSAAEPSSYVAAVTQEGTAVDGWVTITQPSDLFYGRLPEAIRRARPQIVSEVQMLLQYDNVDVNRVLIEPELWTAAINSLSKRTESPWGELMFFAQDIREGTLSGVAYGSVTLDDGAIPITVSVIGTIPQEQCVIVAKSRANQAAAAKDNLLPVMCGTIKGIRAYCTGELAIVLEGTRLTGWMSKGAAALSKLEIELGGVGHPHFCDDIWQHRCDWNNWYSYN